MSLTIKDANRADRVLKTTEEGSPSVHVTHHHVDSVVPGTTATALGKAEDAVHSSGDTGVMALAVRKDTAAALAGTDGDYSPLIVDAAGRLHVALTPGAAASDLGKAEDAVHSSGDVGVMALAVRRDTPTSLAGADGDYIPVTTDSLGRLHTAPIGPQTSGGLSIYKDLDVDENGANVKASAGQVFGIHLTNVGLSSGVDYLYVKLYNKATAPTVGTDTPVMTIPVKADASRDIEIPSGAAFASGIGIGCTTAAADADTGAPATNELIATVLYK